MEAKQKILITLVIGAVLILGFYITTKLITDITGFSISGSEEDKESDFASCLKEQNIVLYVNTDNIAQTIKNIQLEAYLEYVEIINCFGNNLDCFEKGIDSFPTWVVNNNQIGKDISLEELPMVSGCKV